MSALLSFLFNFTLCPCSVRRDRVTLNQYIVTYLLTLCSLNKLSCPFVVLILAKLQCLPNVTAMLFS